jgi:hypothetical protein
LIFSNSHAAQAQKNNLQNTYAVFQSIKTSNRNALNDSECVYHNIHTSFDKLLNTSTRTTLVYQFTPKQFSFIESTCLQGTTKSKYYLSRYVVQCLSQNLKLVVFNSEKIKEYVNKPIRRPFSSVVLPSRVRS